VAQEEMRVIGYVRHTQTAIPLDTPKNALRRLQKEELVVKLEYGHYQIQDEGFVEWLRQLELEE
jgi:hypothetical protein